MIRLRNSTAPATLGLILAVVVGFLLSWTTQDRAGFPWFAFFTQDFMRQPWTALTYPFAMFAGGIISVLFGVLWLWNFGAPVEKDQGSLSFLITFFVFTLLGAGFTALAGLLTGGAGLYSAILPTAAITMIWGARFPQQPVSFWGIRMSALQLSLLSAAIAVLIIGSENSPIVGLFNVGPLGLAWAWASEKLPIAYAMRKRGRRDSRRDQEQFSQFMEGVRERERKRSEEERLRRMFEDSLSDDDKS